MTNFNKIENVYVPVLKNMKKINTKDPAVIFIASNDYLVEQFVSGGGMGGFTFDDRVSLSIDRLQSFSALNGAVTTDGTVMYYSDYDNGEFLFRIYFQDVLFYQNETLFVVRIAHAYFTDYKSGKFYQLSLSTNAYLFDDNRIHVGKIDLINDKITKTITELFFSILKGIHYY